VANDEHGQCADCGEVCCADDLKQCSDANCSNEMCLVCRALDHKCAHCICAEVERSIRASDKKNSAEA